MVKCSSISESDILLVFISKYGIKSGSEGVISILSPFFIPKTVEVLMANPLKLFLFTQ